MYQIKVTEEMGRGLYATRFIPANTTIQLCELLVLSQNDTVVVNQTELKYYTFKYNETQDCLVLGDGEILNHSDTPNIGYELISDNGRIVMQFYSLRSVFAGDQLFIDYAADVKIESEKYIQNKSLLGVS
jgi:SET domain-containing protein